MDHIKKISTQKKIHEGNRKEPLDTIKDQTNEYNKEIISI